DAICGMAKDYRLLDEKNRLLRARVTLMEDKADILRNKASTALESVGMLIKRCSELEDKVRAELGRHTALINQIDVLEDAAKKVTQCVRCEHPEYHEARFSLAAEFPPPDIRVVEHEESDIDLAVKPGHYCEWLDNHPAPKAPILYGNFFDVLVWRWVFNTVGRPSAGW
ncbi:hypothetical protein LCGC14_2788760, partial [marine sediment metagenome]